MSFDLRHRPACTTLRCATCDRHRLAACHDRWADDYHPLTLQACDCGFVEALAAWAMLAIVLVVGAAWLCSLLVRTP
jgi:hypothetical protein